MDTQIILSFLLASVLLTIMPGPDNIFVITESATNGRKTGIFISIGLCLGILVHTLAAATGLSFIIQKSSIAFTIIKYAGALYLFYLAFMVAISKENCPLVNREEDKGEKRILLLIKKGFFMNVLNPKVSLFIIAFLPQFIVKSGFSATSQMLILGLIFALQALIIFFTISTVSALFTKYINHPKFWQITKWSKIGVLSVLGLAIATSKR